MASEGQGIMTYKTENIFKMNTTDFIKYQKQQESWRFKVDFLKTEIEKLSYEKKYPIFWIASFLLKAQVIEFELKQLFLPLDLEVAIGLRKSGSEIHRKIRLPDDFDRHTLNQTISSICEFRGMIDDALKTNLEELGKLRNSFAHHMFDNDKDIKQLLNDAKKGVAIVNKITEKLENLNNRLKEIQTPQKDEKLGEQ